MAWAKVAGTHRVPAPAGGGVLDRTGVRLCYWWCHGRLPRLDEPQLFTEWVQHRKLMDRDPRLPMLADKVAVKTWVAARLGAEWVIPTWWTGRTLPAAPRWPAPFVVKARHGCNQNRFVHDDGADWAATRRAADRWMRTRYGGWLSEWAYGEVPRGVLVEPFIGTGRTLPIDYKIFVFGGRAEFVQVHLGRSERHRWIVLDRHWRRLTMTGKDPHPLRPRRLPELLAAAERLADGFDFVRVDLYDTAAGPRFGELTFYPGSGLLPIDPAALDARWGAAWTQARAKAGRARAA